MRCFWHERETETDRDRQTKTERQRQPDRERQTERKKRLSSDSNKLCNGCPGKRKREREREREGGGGGGRWGGQAGRQTDKQTGRQTQIERQRHKVYCGRYIDFRPFASAVKNLSNVTGWAAGNYLSHNTRLTRCFVRAQQGPLSLLPMAPSRLIVVKPLFFTSFVWVPQIGAAALR